MTPIGKFLLMTLTALALASCAREESVWRYAPEHDKIGRIYYYERSNGDGSKAERITVFRRDWTHVEVYKENGRCENAALVTAEMDWTTFSAAKITGGQLQPEAQHRAFAFLTWEKAARQLRVLVKLPNMEIREDAPIPTSPWHLYDFDLASLTLATPHLANPRGDFAFGMALLWADPSAGDPLTWMGEVSATYAGEETRRGFAARRFTLAGSALSGERSTGNAGALWLDAADGHVVEASFPVPNHPGYRDMFLKLNKVSDGGEAEWTALLKAHFAGC